jgi:acyl dehydratase
MSAGTGDGAAAPSRMHTDESAASHELNRLPRATARQPYFSDVEVGMTLTPLMKGPMTTMHLMRWSAAIENWHRIHYDQAFAVEHDKLPDVLVNGSWKQHVLAEMLQRWVGPEGWVARLAFQYRGMDVRGETVTCGGEVVGKDESGGIGVVSCTISMTNTSGAMTTEGTATVLLPLSAPERLPYPPPTLAELQPRP